MPELNPRRVPETKTRFAQVAAAVLSGMAAMFILQNAVEFRRVAAAPPPPPAAAEPAAPEPVLPVPEGVKRQAGPVPSSMMLKPEVGMSDTNATVVGVSGEEAPPKFEYAPPKAPDAPKPKKKEMPHLESRTMESKFASSAARLDGRFTQLRRRPEKVEAYVPPKPEPAPPPKPRPAGAVAVAIIERASTTLEDLKPAVVATMAPPEVVFWTKARKINIGLAVVLLVGGVIYLIWASGVRDAPPEREEGVL